MVRKLALASLLIIGMLMTTAGAPVEDGSREFRARLTGSQEVPPVETNTVGKVLFRVDGERTNLRFRLRVRKLRDGFAAHIHCAPAGENGPVGVTLFSGDPVTIKKGILASGTIAAPDEGNTCGWTSVADVVAAVDAGNAYVNVHTLANPPGEVRGQLH